MNWSFLITFGVGLGVYFIGLGVFILIKRYRNKKAFDKEQEENEHKEHGDRKD